LLTNLAQLQRLVVAPSQFREQTIRLTREQQHYLTQVLRLQTGQQFVAMNGQGQWWLAELVLNQNSVEPHARILEQITISTELPIPVTLAVALPKGSGFDDVVRQATELGVSQIVPLLSDRTLLNPSPQRLERWRKIAQEATEQSERQIVPTISAPIAFSSYLKNTTHSQNFDATREHYLCVTRRSTPHLMACLTQTTLPVLETIEIAIGPEGGWTDAEIEHAIAAHFQPVTLGQRILRTVTAPIAALSLISAVIEMNSSE
jgi:16S rRNA (uracil1498-N3)-methyltransferase